MHRYQAFGLNIASDLKIIELLPNTENAPMDVQIFAGEVPACVEENVHQLKLNVSGVARILIENGQRIIYQRDENVDDDQLRLFLLGSAMGALLQQRGHVVLHGNAISLNDKTATIFVGKQGAGKSTTAAWHYQ